MITQPHNTTGCIGGTAMFTCVINATVNISTDNIQWWRKRINHNSMPNEIKALASNIFSVTNSNNGRTITSVLIITVLRSDLMGPYWLKVADGTQMSDMAFLIIVPRGTYMCICVLCTYVHMSLCGHMYVHIYVWLCACVYVHMCVATRDTMI